tara:strand:+ start:3201 stop:3947 length:747 start_codon:yes stop_codon:yes gene_type:complete
MTGFITVRTSSSRLNNKCLSKFGSFDTLIEYIIDRCFYFNIDPIICTSSDMSDDIIEKIAKNNNVKIFRGSLENKISRWSACADYFNIDCFHSIDADDPFFDGERMKISMNLLKQDNYDYVKPSYYSDNGGASEGYSISSSFLKKVSKKFNDKKLDTEMAVFYFDKYDNSNYTTLDNPTYATKINEKIPRLTLDYFEDYILLNFLNLVVKDHFIRSNIEKYLNKNKNIVNINIELNKIWKSKQLSKKI